MVADRSINRLANDSTATQSRRHAANNSPVDTRSRPGDARSGVTKTAGFRLLVPRAARDTFLSNDGKGRPASPGFLFLFLGALLGGEGVSFVAEVEGGGLVVFPVRRLGDGIGSVEATGR